jgi:putative methionine-R-sulfoxide reductase with GAF domain
MLKWYVPCRTKSEVVVPYFTAGGDLLGVLDVDSDVSSAFTEVDRQGLETICKLLRGWNVFHESLVGTQS